MKNRKNQRNVLFMVCNKFSVIHPYDVFHQRFSSVCDVGRNGRDGKAHSLVQPETGKHTYSRTQIIRENSDRKTAKLFTR